MDTKSNVIYTSPVDKAMSEFAGTGRLSLETWRDTGRFTDVEDYCKKNDCANVLRSCNTIVAYMGGFFIQVLTSGLFYVDQKNKFDKLEDAEEFLFKSYAEPYYTTTII